MQQNKFLVGGIVLLLLLNLGTLGFLFFNAQNTPQGPPPDGGVQGRLPSISMRLKEPLHLTDEQAAAIESMHMNHLSTMDSLDKDFHDALQNYFYLLTKDNYTQPQKDSLLGMVSVIHAKKATTAFDHFENINKLLNPEQQKKFKEMLPDILRRVIEGNGPPPQDRHGPPPAADHPRKN